MIGVDNMMWGSDYPHSESTFPQSRKILAEILAGVPDDEQRRSPAPTPPACTASTSRGLCPGKPAEPPPRGMLRRAS
ncbi:MAG: amidohydrolase family protein [Candidatus Rokuibacteriota bacterium]